MDVIPHNCGICGNNHHDIHQCNLITITNHLKDNRIPSKAKLTLPNSLQLDILTDGSYSVISKVTIEKGTVFGPYQAPKVAESDPDIIFPLKIFPSGDDTNLDCYLDTRNENECNWLMFINPAKYLEEQNLISYQDASDIFYVSLRAILKGHVLKVWYSPFYAKQMNKEVLMHKPIKEVDPLKDIDINALIKKQQKIEDRSSWMCKFCNQIESNVVGFSKHLLVHYTSQLQKSCKVCNQRFKSRKNLNKHIRVVHQHSDISSSNKKVTLNVGGPLLSDLFTDSSELDHGVNTFDDMDLMLESNHLNFENFFGYPDLNYFPLDDDDDDDDDDDHHGNDNRKQYTCDVCQKQFAKIPSIIAHLRGHTGDLICNQCLKVFCRKENLMAHICNRKEVFDCDICDKRFGLKKNLYRHCVQAHTRRFACEKCDRSYENQRVLDLHNCSQVADSRKRKFVCRTCNKVFVKLSYLKRHENLHLTKLEARPGTICDICGVVLRDKNSYRLHVKRHQEPHHECPECGKNFHRLDTLKNHQMTHNTATIQCPKCHNKVKTLKILSEHMKNVHNEKIDSTVENTIIDLYTCPICDKMMKLRSSLLRHLRRIHASDISIIDNNVIKPKTYPIVTKTPEEHVKTQIECAVCDQVTVPDKSLTFVDEINDVLPPPKEVCVSIPDLTETDQEITLNNDAYILDNGTIVQPQKDSENVVIYVLDSDFNSEKPKGEA